MFCLSVGVFPGSFAMPRDRASYISAIGRALCMHMTLHCDSSLRGKAQVPISETGVRPFLREAFMCRAVRLLP